MPSPRSWPRLILLTLLILGVVAGAGLMLGTETGQAILHDPHHKGQAAREWVAAHRVIAPLVFVVVYLVFGVLALPVWWLQILAGYGFGLAMGIVWAQLASTLASLSAAAISRYLLGDWFRTRIESHIARVQALNERLGHNGLLVVCGVRLAHFMPAGISNYAFGLTRITLRDVTIGTLLGGLPAVAGFVTVGAAPHLLRDWHYLAAIAVVNVLVLGLLLARYLKPEWFRSIGVE